jgi:hypothetical protein
MPYTISIETAGNAARGNNDALLKFMMKRFRPNGSMRVIGSLNEDRFYTYFTEGPSNLGAVADIADRSMIMALSVRVLGELDLHDPLEGKIITSMPVVNSHYRKDLEG